MILKLACYHTVALKLILLHLPICTATKDSLNFNSAITRTPLQNRPTLLILLVLLVESVVTDMTGDTLHTDNRWLILFTGLKEEIVIV